MICNLLKNIYKNDIHLILSEDDFEYSELYKSEIIGLIKNCRVVKNPQLPNSVFYVDDEGNYLIEYEIIESNKICLFFDNLILNKYEYNSLSLCKIVSNYLNITTSHYATMNIKLYYGTMKKIEL